MKSLSLSAVLAVVCALLVGCTSSNEYKPAVKTSSSLQQAAQTVDKTSDQVDASLRSLNAIMMRPGDMSTAFKTYNNSVSDLESTSDDVSKKVAAMREQRDAYFAQWDKDLATIKNEDVRTRSEQRKAEIQAEFKKVQTDYTQLQRSLRPFMGDLKDIRTSLSFNMTNAGITGIQGLAKKANDDAVPVRQSLNALSADFKELGVAVATTMPSTMPAAPVAR